MPMATIAMTRDAAYIVVAFRPKSEPLPEGFAEFTESKNTVQYAEGHRFAGQLEMVAVKLMKDGRGDPDLMPMLTAADWLRDRGWTIEPEGWCKLVMQEIGAA